MRGVPRYVRGVPRYVDEKVRRRQDEIDRQTALDVASQRARKEHGSEEETDAALLLQMRLQEMNNAMDRIAKLNPRVWIP